MDALARTPTGLADLIVAFKMTSPQLRMNVTVVAEAFNLLIMNVRQVSSFAQGLQFCPLLCASGTVSPAVVLMSWQNSRWSGESDGQSERQLGAT